MTKKCVWIKEVFGMEQTIEKQGAVGLSQPVQEGGADDAASAEEQGDAAQVQIPVVVLAGLVEQFKALCIRAELGGI